MEELYHCSSGKWSSVSVCALTAFILSISTVIKVLLYNCTVDHSLTKTVCLSLLLDPDHLPDEQTGCSKARSAAQQTFALRLVVGKVKQRSIDL